MSKSKKKNSEDYQPLYYMCQAYHSKGKAVCKVNLIKKEVVEPKVLS
ncbi:hypothetical protein ABEX77_15370 [Bacillus subtilis]|nr:hypothetical protein [Bacillus sp. SJZ110]